MKKLIIWTDVGDTIIDEGTEVRTEPGGVVHRAACIPGAKEALLTLHEQGYTLCMVADGLIQSFHNTMTQNGLDHVFAAKVISEAVGVEKPHPKMFQTALKALGLTDADKDRIIMVGNHVERDVAGANRFGIRSVQLVWSNRHPTQPRREEERADYLIFSPSELPALADRLEKALH